MLETVAIVVLVLLVAIAAVLVFSASKPGTFRLQRAASIKAPPERIFGLINDFRHWNAWSPWDRMDPALKRTYGGAASGTGAVYEWEGNSKVGKGRMQITDAAPPSRVVIKLDFLKPFKAHNVVEFTLAREGDATRVTWSMHGPVPYPAKIMHVFLDMDRIVGKDFEAGLANLKTTAEDGAGARVARASAGP
jgi:uncharacterized protein YndB with AHSA1/START domain